MDAVKKLLCVLLSVMFLAGCGGQAAAPAPTPVETSSPTPEVTATPEPTPTPKPTIPPLAEIPEEMLAQGGDRYDYGYILDAVIPPGTLNVATLLGAAMRDPANEGKYYCVSAYSSGGLASCHAGLEKQGFRIVGEQKTMSHVFAIGTKEMILALQGGLRGWYVGYIPPKVMLEEIIGETPTIPPLAEIPEEMLVASEGRTADLPYILPEGLPKGTLESGTLLGRAVKDPANDGKYFAVCGHGFGGKLKQLCAALEAAGFRITRAEKSSRIYAVCTEEGLRSLQGGEYGWYFGLVPREVLEHDI